MRLSLVCLIVAGCVAATQQAAPLVPKAAHAAKASTRSPQEPVGDAAATDVASDASAVEQTDADFAGDLSVDDGQAPMAAPADEAENAADVESGNAEARSDAEEADEDTESLADDAEEDTEEALDDTAGEGEQGADEMTTGSCKYSDWGRSFDKAGWSYCGGGQGGRSPKDNHQYISGLWRNDNKGNNDGLYLIEKAYCCRRSPKYTGRKVTKKGGEWTRTLDRSNVWATCPDGYFINGFYKSSDKWIHNLEKAKCTRPVEAPSKWGNCYEEKSVGRTFDKKGLSKCRAGYFLTGLYRGGCDKLYCIENFKCCRMRSPKRAKIPAAVTGTCGPVLKEGKGVNGWTFCYLDRSQTKYLDTQCKDLVKGVKGRGAKGYGCWHARSLYKNNQAVEACKTGVQNDLVANDWPQPNIFAVCVKN